MDAVKAFNSELSSLMDTRPPISKAKMTAITRAAIKAIKFYKHVVQCVEKFIQKCKPEYKVPGLYVVDSIVRQSRHQFTPEKDVFAPRFARNIQNTFMHLFNCPPDDKGKVVRVLNLWQKNQVFTPDVIQPLLDMASRVGTDQPLQPTNGVQLKGTPSQQPRTPSSKPSPVKDPAWLSGNMDISASSNLSSTPVKPPSNSGAIDPNIMQQLQNLQNLLLEKQSDSSQMKKDEVKFDKKLLDFDYDEDDDDQPSIQQSQSQSQPPLPSIDSLQTILSNPEVLRHLQTLQQQMASRKSEPTHDEMEEAMKMRRLQEMRHQEEEFDKHLAQTLPNLPFATECDFKPSGMENSESMSLPAPVAPPQQVSSSLPGAFSTSSSSHPFANLQDQDLPSLDYDERNRHQEPSSRGGGRVDVEVIDLLKNDSPPRKSPRRESRRRRRSRSRGRHSRSRSRSRRRARSSSEDRETERRRKKGLPPIKKNHLAVCSTTLWIGHLSKLVQEEELSDTFGDYGEIVSINLIPPRGCAFVCMNRRQDADKALKALKHSKLHGKAITIAWAPGKAMKEKEWKDYWEVETGTSYIPWSKLSKDTNFALLEEGGMLDEETFPDWLKDPSFRRKGETKETEAFPTPPPQPSQATNGGEQSTKKDAQTKKMPSQEGPLDIPMPTSNIPGFIPLPETTMAPPPASHGQTPSMPPPPMGLLPPPFALPPQRLPGLIGPMGHMGPMMGNVPLGVPPPLMMPPPPQGMVPRMPAPPFNPGPVGMMQLGPDKSKPPQMPGMPDGFPDHLAQMFGLPMGHGMPPGVNLQQQQQSQNQMKGGPSEMDIDDLESKDMNTSMDITHGPPMGGFNQPPPNFNQSPLMSFSQSGLNQKDGQGTPRSGDRKDKDDSRRGRDRDKDRRDGDSRGRSGDRDSSKRRRRGDSNERERGGRGSDRDRNRRGGNNDRNDRNDRNRRDWGKGARNGSKWSDRDKEEDRDRKDKKSSSGGEGKEDRSSGGDEVGSSSGDRDRESRKSRLPSPGSEQQGPPPPLQFPPGQGPPGARPPGFPPGGFGPRFGGPMDVDGMMDGPPPMGGDFPPPMGGDFPPPMGGDFPPPMGGDFPPPMGGDFPPPMGGDFPPPMGGDFMSRGDFSGGPRDFQPRGDFGPRGFFRGPMRPPGPPPQGNRALLRTPNGPMFGPPRGPGGSGPMGMRGQGSRGSQGRMDGPPHGFMGRGFQRMDWRGGPPPRFGGSGSNRWEEGPPRWEDGPPRWEEGSNRWEEGPPPPGPGRWEERRWSEEERPERPERGPRRSRWSTGPAVPPEEASCEGESSLPPSLDRIPEEQQTTQLDETIPPGVSLEEHPPEKPKEGVPSSSPESSIPSQHDNPGKFEESIRPQVTDDSPREHNDSILEKNHNGDGENMELAKPMFEYTEQNPTGNVIDSQEPSCQETIEHHRKSSNDSDVPIESSNESPRRNSLEESMESSRKGSFEYSRDPPRRGSFEDARDLSRRDSFEDSRDPPRRDSFAILRDLSDKDTFEDLNEPPRRDSIEVSREPMREDMFEDSSEPPRRSSFEDSREPLRRSSFENSREPPRRSSFEDSREAPIRSSFEDSREPPRRSSFEDAREPPRRSSFEDSREPPRGDSFEDSREAPRRDSFESSREPSGTDIFEESRDPPRGSMFEDSRYPPPRSDSFENSKNLEPEGMSVEEMLTRQFAEDIVSSKEMLAKEAPQAEYSHAVEESSNDQRSSAEEGTCSESQVDETTQ